MFLARLCYIFGGSEIYRLPYISLLQNNSTPMDRSKNSIQMGYQCKNPLYAVCLSSSTFSSVVHFRCRLHFWVQTLKGERFSGWILSAGGRFSPKRLAAWPFNFQGLMYYLRRRAKERGEWRNMKTHIYRRLMIDQIQILHCNNEKSTAFLLIHKKVVSLFQDELYINANHASM